MKDTGYIPLGLICRKIYVMSLAQESVRRSHFLWYTLSNVILADEKWTSFHQYLRYSHKLGTIAFSTPSAII